MRGHLRVDNGVDDGGFPVRVQEAFPEFRCKVFESEILSQELVLVVLDPVVNFYVLKRHEDVANFVFIGNLAFVKVGIEILNELRENGRGDGAGSEDRSSFMGIVELDSGHVV